MDRVTRRLNKEINDKLVILFLTVIIVSQGIREFVYNSMGINLNYLLVPTLILFYIFCDKKIKIKKFNLIIVLSISMLYVFGFIVYRYSLTDFIRGIFTFIIPIYLLIIDYREYDGRGLVYRITKIYNIYIYISFITVLIAIILGVKNVPTGGIIGHSLTGGWYYVIFIALNMLSYMYYKKKPNLLIFSDILIFMIGTLFTSGRVSIILGMILSLIYVFKCCDSWKIKYVLIPIAVLAFIFSPVFDKIILEKFRYAIGYGDFTNGRLIGIRQIINFNMMPGFLVGKGIGYSNYITNDVFGVVNFENPILMFMFDYGILSTIGVVIISVFEPMYIIIKKRRSLLLITFIIISIIPFTYNGLSEATGLFFAYVIWVFIFSIIANLETDRSISDQKIQKEVIGMNLNENTIPKIIHYCWFGGKEKPDIVKRCIKTWQEKMPDYKIVEWNEENFDINSNKFMREAYKSKKWAFVSDYCRLSVLYKYGGIYLDTDMEVLKSLDEFLENDSFTCTEDNEKIAFGIWGCKKEDKFIKEIMDFYNTLKFDNYKKDLFSIANPVIVTKLALKRGYNVPNNMVTYFADNVAVYPKEYFYPKSQSWEREVITSNTYTIHHYEGSWRSPYRIFRSKVKNVLMRIVRIGR